jgi:hypothetical protein
MIYDFVWILCTYRCIYGGLQSQCKERIIFNENTVISDSELTFRSENSFTYFLRFSRCGIGFQLRTLQAIKLRHISSSAFEYKQKVFYGFPRIFIQTRNRHLDIKITVFLIWCRVIWKIDAFVDFIIPAGDGQVTTPLYTENSFSFLCFTFLNFYWVTG